jgi:hypothetical protein
MVKIRHPSTPSLIVAKPARQKKLPGQAKACCVICRAELRSGHGPGDLVCDSHSHAGANPRCDQPAAMTLTAEERLLVMLYRSNGEPLNVYRAFGCASTDSNKSYFRDTVRHLNERLGPIRGHLRVGYKFATNRGFSGAE